MEAQSMFTRMNRKSIIRNVMRILFSSSEFKELLYRNMLVDGFHAKGLHYPALYPVNSAANYSLLYSIFRCITECGCTSVLELGAGQSSIMIDAVNVNNQLKVLSVETNAFWASKIQSQVKHEVVCIPLKKDAARESYSDLSKIESAGKFDLVIVDGPVGTSRNSRSSALDILNRVLGEEFIVIFDDAERRGEQDTALEFLSGRSGLHLHQVGSNKSQFIIATDKFVSAKYF